MKHIHLFSLVIIALIVSFTLETSFAAPKPKPQLVAEIKGTDLPGNFVDALPEGFDISPDGSRVAAVFETGDKEVPKTFGIWIAVWDISSKKLLNKLDIEGPLTLEQLAIPGAERDLRYTPSGDAIVVQTGLALFIIRTGGFAKMLSVKPMSLPTTSRNGTFIERFDISADGRWLAALTGIGADSRPIAGVQLIDLSDGKVAAEWSIRDSPSSIALSPNGSQILLSGLGDAGAELGEIRLVDAQTGKILRSFKSGCVYLAACGASDARFWGEGRIVIVPKAATDAHGNSLVTDMKTFDANSGQLIRELKRQRFQSMGKLTIAANAPIVLTISASETSEEIIGEQWFHRSKPELVAFNLDDGDSRTVIRPVGHGQAGNTVDQYSLRISHDGSLIAFFQDKAIKIYRLSSSDLPLKKKN
ncbi:MAG TPA: hypothetical protein VGJ33_21080 [Candidatus Angelobacter sp.]|jgi:WD40 repeat protein